MSRRLLTVCGVVLAVLVGSVAISAPVPKEAPKDSWVGDRLQKVIDFGGIDDPKITLKDALNDLSKKADVTFRFNLKGFRQVMIQDPQALEVAATRPVPATKASLANVLREILDNVEIEDGLTFLLRGERIEILPTSVMRQEIYGDDVGPGAAADTTMPTMPLVHIRATDRSFRELMQDVSAQAEVNILVDPRCGEKTKVELTAKLVNTPAETAVEMLADMAGLEMVQQRNVLYVTTPDNAAKIRKEQERKAAMGMPPGFGPGRPGLGGPFPGFPGLPPGMGIPGIPGGAPVPPPGPAPGPAPAEGKRLTPME
jgi:hypothetical protein